MTFNKKALKITAIVLAAVIFVTAAVFAFMGIARAVKINGIDEVVYNGEKLNVILMIGDGMGFNHLKAAEARYGELFMKSAPVQGEVRLIPDTFSAQQTVRLRQPLSLPA